MQSRREFCGQLAAMAGLAMAPGTLRAAEGSSGRPNIVVFLIDDMGWGDLGCYGDTFHETPHIDQLARESMKFTNAYAGAPVCSPSRAAILTGQAPARLHLTQWIPGVLYPYKQLLEAPTPLHLQAGIPTIASVLKSAGYRTAAIGKWHLGGEGYLPENFGFDVNIAGDNHGHPPSYFGPFHFHNLTGYTAKDYLTDVLTEKMDAFVRDAAKKGPFFLYMAEYSVHLPLEAKLAMIEKYRRKNGGPNADGDARDPVYAAMIESTDIALGSLRTVLERAGVADNTIILLTSDNGGVGFQGRKLHRIADNGGLRAGKGFLYEGGIREPLLVHWPGVTKPGSVCDVPIIGTDFMSTVLAMAEAGPAPQPADGLDFSALLRGGSTLHRDTLYWHYPHYSDQGGKPSGAIREGEWKLIEFFEDNHVELYNLTLDPGEQYDLASSFGEKAVALRAKLHAWRARMNAAMPTPNPRFNPQLEVAHAGPVGCSWESAANCRED
ncbi:MAG: sulfatase [Acidobacteriota bacterium]|nr:sulfatase [Acidobacteriota bacterium]